MNDARYLHPKKAHRMQHDAFSGERMRRMVQSLSKTQIALFVIWMWMLSWGEKRSFRSHVSKCKWENWERWVSRARYANIAYIDSI